MAASRVRARVLGFAFLLAVVTYLDRDLHLRGGALHHGRPAPERPADERRLQRLHAVVFAVRDPLGLARRREGAAARPDAHRAVVVGVHDADVARRAAFSRSSRSGSCSAPARRAPFRTSRGASRTGFRSASAAAPTACMFLGSRVGGMLSAPIALLIVSRWGWRTSFVLFGAIGVVWAAAWFAWYRDRPEEHPSVDARRSSRGSGRIDAGPTGRPAASHAVARAAAQPEPVRDLRDVLRVRLRPVFLLHLAADLPDQGARASRVLARRAVRVAAVPARRHRGSDRRLADRPPVPHARLARRPLLSRVRRVPHLRGAACSRRRCRSRRSRRRCCSRSRWRRRISRSAPAGPCRSTSRPITPA